jgi:hypothetical protein
MMGKLYLTFAIGIVVFIALILLADEQEWDKTKIFSIIFLVTCFAMDIVILPLINIWLI